MCSKAGHESGEVPFLLSIAFGLPSITHVEQPSFRRQRLGHLTTFGGEGKGGWEVKGGFVVGRGGREGGNGAMLGEIIQSR